MSELCDDPLPKPLELLQSPVDLTELLRFSTREPIMGTTRRLVDGRLDVTHCVYTIWSTHDCRPVTIRLYITWSREPGYVVSRMARVIPHNSCTWCRGRLIKSHRRSSVPWLGVFFRKSWNWTLFSSCDKTLEARGRPSEYRVKAWHRMGNWKYNGKYDKLYNSYSKGVKNINSGMW